MRHPIGASRREDARGTGRSQGHAPITYALLCAAVFTSSWTGIRVHGLTPYDPLIVVTVISAAFAAVNRAVKISVPLFLFAPLLATLIVMEWDSVVLHQGLTTAAQGYDYEVGQALGDTTSGPAVFFARLFFSYVALGVALFIFRYDRSRLMRVATLWCVGTSLSAAWAFAQTQFHVADLPFQFHITSDARAVGLANHPNSLGQSAAMAVPLAMFLLFGQTRGVRRTWGGVMTALLVYAVFVSGSRTGFVMVAIAIGGAVLILLANPRRAKFLLPLVGAIVVAAVFFAGRIIDLTRFGQASSAVSDSLRFIRLQDGWAQANEHFLMGGGIYSWQGEMVPLVLLTSGGLFLTAAFYLSWLPTTFRLMVARSDAFLRICGLISVVFIAAGFLNNAIVERYLYVPMLVGAALIPANARKLLPDRVPGLHVEGTHHDSTAAEPRCAGDPSPFEATNDVR